MQTKLSEPMILQLQNLVRENALLASVIQALQAQGATVLLVGGAVRDLLLGLPTKDLDIELHGLPLSDCHDVLAQFGPVGTVGKSFGVLRLYGLDIDWSLPRTDATGRKPEVVIDPTMSYEQAFSRRDLTINAMGIDLRTYELIDPFDGYRDLQNKVLRAPDPELFIEDPLRFYRVMQFIARFEMHPDEQLNNLCAAMDIATVSRERIEQEFAKMWLMSKRPSRAFVWLNKIGRLKSLYPELYQLQHVPQEPDWHPEGDVFEHTMQAIDAAEKLSYRSDEQKIIVLYAVLCHDMGKASTTEKIDGRIRSHGHAQVGAELAKEFLKKITKNNLIIDSVVKLVNHHMDPLQLQESKAKPSAYKRLALKLAPDVTIQTLGLVVRADKLGRNPQRGSPLDQPLLPLDLFLQKAEDAKVLEAPEAPRLLGKHLMDEVSPGPDMGRLVKAAYQIQIQEGITDIETLKKRVLKLL